MFPLGTVVLPGEPLALRVFEPRYRRLVLDCLAASAPVFGTVLIERGLEVGGGDERTSVGTVVVLRTVSPIEGGQFHLATYGVARLRVTQWLPDDPYPIAEVGDLRDEPAAGAGALADEVAALAARVAGLRALAGATADLPPLRLDDDAGTAGYQLAAAVPLGPADRYRVLEAPSAAARLAVLGEAFDDLEAVLRFQAGGSPPA